MPVKKGPTKPVSKTKKSTRKSAKKAVLKKKPTRVSKKSESVILPDVVSNEALKKVESSRVEFDTHYGRAAYIVSYVVGLCFILVGSFVAIDYVAKDISPMSLVGQASGTDESLYDELSVDTGSIPSPIFSWRKNPPSYPEGDFQIEFELSYAEFEAKVIAYPTSEYKFMLDPDLISDGKYGAHVPIYDLDPGLYKIKINIFPYNGEPEFGKISQTFEIVDEDVGTIVDETEEEFIVDFPTDVDHIVTLKSSIPLDVYRPFELDFELDRSAETVAVKLINVDTGKRVVLPATTLVDFGNNRYETNVPVYSISSGLYKIHIYVDGSKVHETHFFTIETTDGGEEFEPDEQLQFEHEVSTTSDYEEEVTIETEETSFYIHSNGRDVLTGIARLEVSVPAEFFSIELYARPANSLDARFVTRAVKQSGVWQFIFDTNDIPNGDHLLFSQAENDGVFISSNKLEVNISNFVLTDDTSSFDGSQETAVSEPRPILTLRDTSDSKSEVEFIAEDQIGETEDPFFEADRLLENNEDDIDDLLKRFAVAVQSGDQVLIDAASASLEGKVGDLSESTLEDDHLRPIADDIQEELFVKVDDLKDRIERFEQVRKEKTSGGSAEDTDGDGISDIDEINLYNTDPEVADSDNDGVTDGIEIVRGFNPLDEASEAVIEFESPKESIGLVRTDALVINNVLSLTADDPEPNEVSVKTEIRGKALPNSFVTLYIFSTPTVVTIKTDADGSFVYTFEKELEDGEHEVYVAVTDNAGKIMAQSNPFTFVKEAQAFTPVDASENDTVSTDTISGSTDGTYNIVIGIAILAFGIILLMLGIGLRSKRESMTTASVKEADPEDTHFVGEATNDESPGDDSTT